MTTPQVCPNDASRTCDPACAQQQGAGCSLSGRIALPEVLSRFQAEAVYGSCDTGRYRCAYFSWGAGPPLLFIHGLADLPASFVMTMSLLSSQFRCIGYGLPEGNSDGANLRSYTHSDLVDDLFALFDHLGLERGYLFGSSFGSTIALAAMHAQPARVPRVMLQGGFARRPLGLGAKLLVSCARFWPGRMRHLPFRTRFLRRYHYGPLAARSADIWVYFQKCVGTPHLRAVARRALMMQSLDLRPLLPQLRQPVLLICGDQDPLVGKDCEDDLLRGLPVARRVEILGCGHYPYFSHPEALAEIIREFLTPQG